MKICMDLLYRIRSSIVNDYLYPQTLFSTDSTTVPQYIYFNFPPSCIMPLRLRSPRHHAPVFRFFSHYAQGKHTSFVGILAWRPPRYLHTVAYGMCSVPSHIPYPSASLRERSYASVAPQSLPLPPRSPTLPIYFFSKFSFPCGSTGSLKSAFIIEELSIFGELYRKITYPEFLNNRFFRWDLHMKIRDKFSTHCWEVILKNSG